jgi:hypothetical protein
MLVHTHDYDNSYNPSIPAIEVQIYSQDEQKSLNLKAIVDSGADVSMIPTRHLRQLGIRKRRSNWLSGIAGGQYEVDLFSLLVQIGRSDPFYIEVVGSERKDEIIVGRDVLNQFLVSLNGLAGAVEVFT